MRSFLKVKISLLSMTLKQRLLDSTRFALANNNKIIWILGGQPKLKDKLLITKFKNRIIKLILSAIIPIILKGN